MTGVDLRRRAGRACVFVLLICGTAFLSYSQLGPIGKRLPFL